MENEYRILVCGGRDFQDKIFLFAKLSEIVQPQIDIGKKVIIIQGEARGADRLAKEWAIENNVDYLSFFADWDRLGKKAGYVRNAQMLNEGKPHLVVAFSGGKGTSMMVDIAKKANVLVHDLR